MERRMLVILLCSGIVFHFTCAERQFFFVNQHLSWDEAQTYCRNRYTDLITVYNTQENQELTSLAQDANECVWMGLYHEFQTWRWTMEDPAYSTDQNDAVWGIDQPNNDFEDDDCASLYTHDDGLDDYPCSSEFYFICFDAVNQYILVEEYMTWWDAENYCRIHYEGLATIDSDVSPMLLDQLYDLDETDAWVGIYRDPWSVWSDNSYTNFSNWETQPTFYPNNGRCGCLSSSTGKWKETFCSARKPFFCYGDQKQTVLKMKLQSEIDLNNTEIQLQILEQMQNRLASMGVANVTVKWKTTQNTTSDEADLNPKCINEE